MRTLNLIVRYNLRSLILRGTSTGAIFLSVAIVIGVFCYLLTLEDGLRRALTIAADPFNVIVLAQEATAESNSALPEDAFATVVTPVAPGSPRNGGDVTKASSRSRKWKPDF